MATKNGYNRRDFLKIVGVSTGMAAAGCSGELPEKIIPYVIPPDDVVPGVATWYAASCGECGGGCGVLVRTREGRAVKVEGNPSHPINQGGLCAHGQSSIQAHYDPDRIREPLSRDANQPFKPLSWGDALDKLVAAVKDLPAGKEAVLLTGSLSGSNKALVSDLQAQLPALKHVEYELFGRDVLNVAAERSFGTGARMHFDFSEAHTIVSFGADFLETWISPVEFARQWAETRNGAKRNGKGGFISNFFQIEPRMSLTAANADRWIMNLPGSELRILRALLSLLLKKGGGKVSRSGLGALAGEFSELNLTAELHGTGVKEGDLTTIVESLLSSTSSLVISGGAAAGGETAVQCAVIANLINATLGNIGKTVLVTRMTGAAPATLASDRIRELADKINGKENPVSLLIVAGPNPAYTLPDSVGFSAAVSKVPFVVSISSHLDETTSLAQLVLPKSTGFESWGDSEPAPGVYNINQPSMQPMYKTQSFGDTLVSLALKLQLNLGGAQSFLDYIKTQWKKRVGESGFESRWLELVEKGGEYEKLAWSRNPVELALAPGAVKTIEKKEAPELSLLVFPTVNSQDGSAANRPWMQELPNPMTTAVWGSWIEIHPELAAKHGISRGDVVQVRTEQGIVESPAFITKYVHPNLVAIPLGQGHEAYGRYATGVGANALKVLPAAAKESAPSFVTTVTAINKTHAQDKLVTTQGHDSQEKRALLRSVAAATVLADSNDAHGHGANGHGEHGGKKHHDPEALGPQPEPLQMYKQMEHPQYRWGMSIDLASCTGCSSCVVACYAENNIPVVGKDICAQGREMSWLRIDRYFDGSEEQPVDGFMPMLCQHCGNAPCEPVCPVYATYHNEEGLNTMVYNRCVGTRYCSNNCSYKVRRFNWFRYNWTEPLTWQLNPDVTVREVGIMEKCTFCVQRIREGENKAKNLGRPVQDGDIQPACASSCPTKAITFGNLLDHESEVYKKSQSPRAYKVLDQAINTQPAISYLARVKNETAKVS